MHKKSRILEIASCDLNFLPNEFDEAILGIAEQGSSNNGNIRVCYGYQAIKSILGSNKITPLEIYARIHYLFSNISDSLPPIILMKFKRKPLWNIITNNRFPIWESLNKAILGLCYDKWEYTGVIYNKQTCINIIDSKQITASNDPLDGTLQALNLVENDIIPVHLGKNSPWFLTKIN